MPYTAPLIPMDWEEAHVVVEGEFRNIQDEFSLGLQLPVLQVAPRTPSTGLVVCADGTAWNPGGGFGVYVYNGSAWVKL